MRITWKRTLLGALLAGMVGGAALGLGQPAPEIIPLADAEPAPAVPVLPALATPEAAPGTPVTVPVQALESVPKMDPSIALEWAGPPVVKVNTPTEYTLLVKNTSGQSLQKVVVQVKVPKETDVKGTTPAAKPVEGVYLWELGTLEPKASRSLKLTLVQVERGELAAQAWVTFTGTAGMKVAVRQPKLEIRARAPQKVVYGETYPLEYTVKNVGDFVAESVQAGLAGAKPRSAPRSLKPGEEFTVTDILIATPSGTLLHEAIATGSDGLNASAKAQVQILMPRLALGFQGPAECLIGKRGTYSIRVENSGDVPVADVVIREAVPASFRVLAAGSGGVVSPQGDLVSWRVGELAPGEKREVSFEALGTQSGSFIHQATAEGSRNTRASAEAKTRIAGIPALRMELVDLADPIEKGQDTTYEVRVANTGSRSDADLRVICQLPPQLKFKSATGPVTHSVNDKGEVAFDLIRELAPKTEAVLRITVTGVKTGDARFKAVLTSKHLSSGVIKEESTHVYGE